MARLAVIDEKTNLVMNVAEAEVINPIEGMVCVWSDTANIGDNWDGTNFVPRPQEL